MTEVEAQALATTIRQATSHEVEVEPDDNSFVVTVRRAMGDTFTLWDEADWDWLGPRIRGLE